jgi:hypothetical protein
VDEDVVVAAGVEAAGELLDQGKTVVVVDGADALTAFLDGRGPDAPGRVAVLVGDPGSEADLEAARHLANQLFRPG